jgi:hypothetical protein
MIVALQNSRFPAPGRTGRTARQGKITQKPAGNWPVVAEGPGGRLSLRPKGAFGGAKLFCQKLSS